MRRPRIRPRWSPASSAAPCPPSVPTGCPRPTWPRPTRLTAGSPRRKPSAPPPRWAREGAHLEMLVGDDESAGILQKIADEPDDALAAWLTSSNGVYRTTRLTTLDLLPRQAQMRVLSSRNDAVFQSLLTPEKLVVWRSEDVQARERSFDEAREDVEKAWRLDEA